MSLRTEFEFTLPRGYVDSHGVVHRKGTMRLATARDELEPLRDPTITGPDDPRLTIIVLARVVESLGTLELVTTHEIEGLFAADLAFLQDFYGVINFGSEAEFHELLAAMDAADGPVALEAPVPAPAAGAGTETTEDEAREADETPGPPVAPRPGRSAIEEIPTDGR